MTSPLPGNTSQTARLLGGALGFQVGWQEPRYKANPAAGAPLIHVVDGRYSERLLTMSFTLTTDAVVGSRFPGLQLTDTNGVAVITVPAGNAVVASSSLNVNLMLNGPAYSFGSSGGTYGFVPDLIVPPGWAWQAVVFGMDPGDQISAGVVLVQRFPNDSTAISASG